MFIALGVDQSSRAILGVAVAWGIPGMTAFEWAWISVIGFMGLCPILAALQMALEGDIIDALFQISIAAFLLYIASWPVLIGR